MIQASTLLFEGDEYVIRSPLRSWYGNLAPIAPITAIRHLSLFMPVEACRVQQGSLSSSPYQGEQGEVASSAPLRVPSATGVTIAIDSSMGVAPIVCLYHLWRFWHQQVEDREEKHTQEKETEQGHSEQTGGLNTEPAIHHENVVNSIVAMPYALDRGDIPKKMHLIMVEEHPLCAVDAQRLFRELAGDYPEVNDLAAQWPLLLPGMHRLEIAQGQFTVTMLYAQSASWLPMMASVDGLLLGLPGMRVQRKFPFNGSTLANVYTEQEGCSADQEDAELAQQWSGLLRLTQAHIRVLLAQSDKPLLEQLGKNAHIVWQEEGQGQGAIDHASIYSADSTTPHHSHVWLRGTSKRPLVPVAASRGRHVCVIGAGLAGAGVAYAMASRGWRVKVIDAELALSSSASHGGHLSAALTPLMTLDDSHKARLSRAGTLRAHARWSAWGEQAGINPCGTLELNRNKGHAKDILDAVRALAFPQEWVRLVDAQEASRIAGIALEQHGAFFPYGMQVSPEHLIQKLLDHPLIERVAKRVERIEAVIAPDSDTHSARSEHQSKHPHYILWDKEGREIAQSAQVICATALATAKLLKRSDLAHKRLKSGQVVNAISCLDTLHAMGGEVMQIPAQEVAGGPHCIVAGQGYFLPAYQGQCVMGGTYIHNQSTPPVSSTGQEAILAKLPFNLVINLPRLQEQGKVYGWSGTRAVTQGRMPVIGPLTHAPGVWLACAYASHGLTWSSLAGDIIATLLEGEPVPIERELWNSIRPR